jgi:fructuronate reductase
LSHQRLSDATLSALSPTAEPPVYDRSAIEIGVVHFGPGAFHRAHQAFYFDALLKTDPRWAISEVALRTPGVRDALQPQDGLYGLAMLDEVSRWRVIGAIGELLVASETPERVLDRLAAPATHMVTLTVTEKGYALTGEGELDFDHPDVRHDLAAEGPPLSAVGWLVAGLARRRAASLAPFTVISCDNLSDNGRKLRAAVIGLARRRDPALAAWIEAEARFPRTMVDSITPATDAALRERAIEALGLEDAWPIQREAFAQWVIEDDFGPGPQPDWAGVGVMLTDDVGGWDRAKLRLLNGAHSTLAYLGLLRGHETVAEAMADTELSRFVRKLMSEDIRPSLDAPRGLDLDAYIEAVLKRFRNPAIRHRLSQIAWDGSQKLPVRLLGTVRDALAAGRPVDRLALPLAAWMRFIRARALSGDAPTDPMAEALMTLGARLADEAAGDTTEFLALEPVFGADLPADAGFRAALVAAYERLLAAEARGGAGGLDSAA